MAFSFVDQAFSSITNFGLSLLAGRLLGPAGLGRVYLAFSIYLIALVLQRSLLTDSLLAITSAGSMEHRDRTARLGLSLSLLVGATAAVFASILGVLVPGTAGTALLLVAPWLVPALVQDYWRNLLFRERRASAAAANDGIWLAVMVAAVPLAWVLKTEWAAMMAWGLGATGGAIAGFRQTRVAPSSAREAWAWWVVEAWPFGRWNAGAAMIVNLGSNATAFVLAAIVGAGALGGFRAVQSLFAPLSLIAPAVSLPGLPAMARAYAVSYPRARTLLIQISGIAVAASVGFFVVLLLGGWRLLPALFGSAFGKYRGLISAIAIGQLFSAAGVGFPLLIKVQQRGRFLLASRLVVTIAELGLIAASAAAFGLTGAAWATALVALLASSIFGLGALRDPRPPRAR